MLVGALAPSLLSAQTRLLPYAQDFENFSACIADCRFACNMTEQWENATGDDTDWSIWFGATGTPKTGPQQDFAPGTSWGKYLYVEASGGCQGGAEAHLLSPTFDFKGLNQPVLSFAYHMFGIGQGLLHVDVDTSGVWVLDVIPPLHSDQDVWQLTQNCLPWLADQSSVRFRIRGVTGRTETSDLAIDAFEVYNAHPVDVAIQQILKDGCGLGDQETISFQYTNLGLTGISSLFASYSIDNGPFTAPEMISGGLQPCGSDVFSFNQIADLSAAGVHKIKVAIRTLQQDPDQKNDTLVSFVRTVPKIDKFPYEESFEHGTSHWEAGGENSSWQWGVPRGNWIQQAPYGKKAWFTANAQGTYNNEEFSFLHSPCFDFSALKADPVLAFEHTYQLENALDSSWLEYSLNGGATWMKVSQHFTPIDNWYNFNTEQVWSNTSAAGMGNWQTAAIKLDGLAGETVRFRFVLYSDRSIRKEGIGIDRIRILLPHDVAVTAIETPYDTCGGYWGSQEPVRVRVWNKGYYGIPNLQMSYYVSGSSGFITPEPIPGILKSGDSTTFTFQTLADISALGKHFITVTAILVNDDAPKDNSFNRTTSNYPWATVEVGNDTVICKGDLVKIKAYAPDAVDFLWSDGSQGAALLTGKRGIHKLTVMDKNGCMGVDSMLLDLLPQPQARINFMEPVRCYGDSTGILDLQLYGSIPPYQFVWDDAATTIRRTNLPAGFYPFKITDQNGCSLRDSIEMKQKDSIQITLDKIMPSGCPIDSSGRIDISVSGGQAPYSYFWSNGAESEDLSRILDGKYAVFISDAFGCSALSEDYQVFVSDTLPRANFSYRITGGTVTIIDSSQNTVSHTYSFGDGSEPIDGVDVKYTYSENGTYEVQLIAENSCGRDTFILEIQVKAVSNDNLELASVIKIGPNPVSKGYFFLHFQNPNLEDVELKLFDLNGKLCLSEDLQAVYRTTSHRVNVPANLSDGYYLVEVNTHKGRIRQKLIIHR
jgi:hypothetical protein